MAEADFLSSEGPLILLFYNKREKFYLIDNKKNI